MKKSTVNAIVDALLVISLLGVLFQGILLGFVIGRGSVPPEQKFLWGLHRHDWGDLHRIFSLAFIGLAILHFILHINWVSCMSKRCVGLHWAATLGILVIIAAGILYGSIVLKRAHPGRWGDEEGLRGQGRGQGLRQQEGFPAPGEGRRGGQGRGLRGQR
jgi:hypothetical protein